MNIPLSARPSQPFARLRRTAGQLIGEWNRIGSQTRFYAQVLSSIPNAVTHYRTEMLRLAAELGMGAGTLAMVGGSVGVIGLILLANGSALAVIVYQELGNIGLDALTGIAGSLINLRFMVPASCIVALITTVGAGTTAQIGAMRINEEIDALEVIGIRSVTYLASTRVVVAMALVTPQYCLAAVVAFFASRITTTVFFHQGSGVYDHYFNTFFIPIT